MVRGYEKSYIRTLQNIAKNLDNGLRCKHAAMLVVNGKIISMGVNKAKSDPFQKANSRLPNMSWTHAEVDTLKGVRGCMKRATIFVVRTDDKGNFMESCPCLGCRGLINKMKIPRIIHSTIDGTIIEVINDIH